MATRKVSDKILEVVLKSLTARFGENYKTKGLASVDLEAIPTGHDDLDVLLTKGARGLAKGCIVELMGSEGSGKTSIAMRVVANAQKSGELCAWFDTERAFSYALSEINGMSPSKLFLPPLVKNEKGNDDSFELMNVNEILEMVYRSICANIYGVVVLDSVAGLIPERVLAEDFNPNSAGMAEVARAMSSMLGKIAQASAQTQTTVIFINQLREKPGEYFKDRFHTPGGRALKFFAHQRLSIEKKNGAAGQVFVKDEEGHDELIGHYARCTIVKNRMAPPVPPNVSIEIPIYYVEYNPDDAKKTYDLARSLQVVTIRNGTLTWKENDDIILKVEGEADFLSAIREQQLESHLAMCCANVAKEEKNAKKKQPVRVPIAVDELASTYVSSKPKAVPKKKSTKKVLQTDLEVDGEI